MTHFISKCLENVENFAKLGLIPGLILNWNARILFMNSRLYNLLPCTGWLLCYSLNLSFCHILSPWLGQYSWLWLLCYSLNFSFSQILSPWLGEYSWLWLLCYSLNLSFSQILSPWLHCFSYFQTLYVNETHTHLSKTEFETSFFYVSLSDFDLYILNKYCIYSFPCWCYVFRSYVAQLCSVKENIVYSGCFDTHWISALNKFLDPGWRNRVDSGIGLSYRPVSLCSPMGRIRLCPLVKDYEFGLMSCLCGFTFMFIPERK
jgi:hypothetical protein